MPKSITQTTSQRMAKLPARYSNEQIIDHLASHFVLGQLSAGVTQRVISLMKFHDALEARVEYWQQRFVVLDQQTPPLPPSERTWRAIEQQLDLKPINTNQQQQPQAWLQQLRLQLHQWVRTPVMHVATAFSAALLALIVTLNYLPASNNSLSYVAVLTQPNGEASLVASAYHPSRTLVLNIVHPTTLSPHNTLELWAISKSDQQVRSLGVISSDKKIIEQQLSRAQWRLIKDSHSLIVTVEETDGSAIGEPSEHVVARGLCVRLEEWKNNA